VGKNAVGYIGGIRIPVLADQALRGSSVQMHGVRMRMGVILRGRLRKGGGPNCGHGQGGRGTVKVERGACRAKSGEPRLAAPLTAK